MEVKKGLKQQPKYSKFKMKKLNGEKVYLIFFLLSFLSFFHSHFSPFVFLTPPPYFTIIIKLMFPNVSVLVCILLITN